MNFRLSTTEESGGHGHPCTYPTPIYLAMGAILVTFAIIKLPLYQSTKHLDTFIVLLGLIAMWRYAPVFLRTWPTWAMFAAFSATLATWGFGQITHPTLISPTPKPDQLTNQFLFLFFAVYLLGSVRKTLFIWLLAVASLSMTPWILGGGWGELAKGWSGYRIELGIHNSQHTAVVYGSALIGWTVFAPRVWGTSGIFSLRGLGWATIQALLLLGFIASQTRAAYIGMGLVVMLSVILLLAQSVRSQNLSKTHARSMLWIAIALLLSSSIFLVFNKDRLVSRFGESSNVLSHIQKGDWTGIPSNSLGLRIHSWRAGMEWFKKYPVFGVGRNGGSIVIKNTPWLRAHMSDQFGHMHSSYVEYLVRYGLFGFGIFVSLVVWTTYKAHQTWKAGGMTNDFYMFFWLFFIFYAWVNLFESFMFYTTGILPFTLVMSGLLGFIWRQQVTPSTVHAKL